MDAMLFLNQFFQYAALNNFAKMLDGHAMAFDAPEDLVAVGADGVGHDFPDEGIEAYKAALAAEEEPEVCYHPEHGWFVVHTFDRDSDEPDLHMRMVCWAEMGPQKFNEMACQWWKDQGANPDKIVPGVTDLHRGEGSTFAKEPGRVPKEN